MPPDPGIELALDGRLYTHVIELWNEVRLDRVDQGYAVYVAREP